MSLILDALRKLEREKDPRAPGVLVVGSVPWGETSRTRRVVFAGLAAAAMALAVGVGWLLRATPAPRATPVPPVTTPTLAVQPAPTPMPQPAAPPLAWAPQATLPPAPPIRISRPAPTRDAVSPKAAPETARDEDVASEPVAADAPTAVEPAAQPPPGRIEVAPAATEADPSVPAPAPDGLRLNAISKRDGRSVALINDRLVFEGDSFDGVRVIRIGEAEVEVEVKGERRVLRF
jgi:hypothetical protein